MRNAYKILVGKSEVERPLGRHRSRWEDDIRMNLREMRRDVVDWLQLAQDRNQWQTVMNKVMNIRVP
jgi:hypothetical protein